MEVITSLLQEINSSKNSLTGVSKLLESLKDKGIDYTVDTKTWMYGWQQNYEWTRAPY
ncbi:MAG: hypothetical protein Q9M91_01785 [Candidatus Dojkabacteria bacterium]|nr:hypothetical protein [Candidatus Dojkabacteria bacterium]